MVSFNAALERGVNKHQSHFQEIDILKFISYSVSSNPANSLSYLNIFKTIYSTLFAELYNLSYFWIIFCLVLSFYSKHSEISLQIYFGFCLLFVFTISLFQNIRKLAIKARDERKNDEQIVNVCKEFGIFQVKIKSLQVGDFVILSKGDQIPADLLILSCGSDTRALVDMRKYYGLPDLLEKQALQSSTILEELTTDDILIYLSKIESLEVSLPNPSIKAFTGKIRFKGDPKVYTAKAKHLALKSSKLVTESLAGLVVYTGIETKLGQSSAQIVRPIHSQLNKFLNTFHLITFIIISVLVVLTTTLGYYNSENYIEESVIWNI